MGNPSTILKCGLTWEEIDQARADRALQRKGWREYPPESEDLIYECPACGRRGTELSLIYYRCREGAWGMALEMEGWVVACMKCREQAGFLPTLVIS